MISTAATVTGSVDGTVVVRSARFGCALMGAISDSPLKTPSRLPKDTRRRSPVTSPGPVPPEYASAELTETQLLAHLYRRTWSPRASFRPQLLSGPVREGRLMQQSVLHCNVHS